MTHHEERTGTGPKDLQPDPERIKHGRVHRPHGHHDPGAADIPEQPDARGPQHRPRRAEPGTLTAGRVLARMRAQRAAQGGE